MLWSASDLTRCGIDAIDGSIGTISDLLFDDETWMVRWFVVGTGVFFTGRRVLLPPSAVVSADAVGRSLAVDVTREQVKDSPELDFDAPVSRQHERSLYSHYGWDPYWGPHTYFAAGDRAPVVPPQPSETQGGPEFSTGSELRTEGDPHLRSVSEVTGYYVLATDGDIGHVEDFVVDTDAWAIRYIAVDTVNWLPGKKVLISPTAITEVVWAMQTVNVDLTRKQIRGAPEYLPGRVVDRAYEAIYHDYYGYPYYWK
ncbi:PRC-barrel domain-containing protein [Sinorhizobium numidicum]|uniref:PRC-barrel domain-containing protein n=1 Tax=Sinorhizobium numidicum TaxID=680248 RepID=A0ABY8CTQ2_9HYPH|nr:PRC-barrel domain-containing protein [Sinorhizobium numidicum]WEX74113.1 PRC-barrel domain-containing protein [Sinorhizobium numidicum]WEX80098.1 PRC-barrel domain-containing protein [Sinorhizobium numidicum]